MAWVVKNLPANARATGDESSTPGSGRSHGGESGTHCSILAQRIPRTEELSRLQSTGPQRVRHDWATEHAQVHRKTERKMQRFPLTLCHTHAQLLPLSVSPIRAAHLLQLMNLRWHIISAQSPSLTLGVTLHTHYSKGLNKRVMTCIHYYSIIRVFPLL